mgnify:CR=1 FL=1
MRRIAVGDIMTRNFSAVNPGDNLHKCAKIMAKNRVNSLLVAENKRLFGILTARDILWIITKKPNIDLTKIRSIDVATKKIAVIKPSADISEALSKMRESNFRRLPVLSHSELIGVVTLKDILVVEPSLYSEVRDIIDSVKEEDRKLKTAGKQWPTEGLCENCGAFSELLNVEGRLLCPDCRDEIY